MKFIHILKLNNQRGHAHLIMPVLIVGLIAVTGVYVLKHSNADSLSSGNITGISGVCLDVSGTPANNSQVVADKCSTTSTKWTLTSNDIIQTGNLCLADKGGSTAPETHARVETCSTSSATQKWQVSAGSIKNSASNLCLEDRDGKTTNGNTVWLNSCATTPAQTWIVPGGSTSTGTGTGSTSCSTPPSTPGNVTATPVATPLGVTVKWSGAQAAANCTLSTYTIYSNGSALATSSSTSYTDDTVTAGSTYKYSVAAADTSGHMSAQSSMVSVTIPSASSGSGSGSGGSGSGGTTGKVVSVSTAAQLTAALATATPGQTIELANGTYDGNFVTTVSGTASNPIILTGSRQAILVGPKISGNYALHLSGANYWQINGISLTGAQKGIVLDKSSNDVVNGVQVYGVGDEGIHVREGSTYDTIENNYVHNTGLSDAEFGEGIYVGSAIKNWPLYWTAVDQYGNKVDASDHNSIINNTVSNTGAENIDTKEGTANNTVSGNTLSDPGQGAAAIDVKGNNYTVSSNTISGATTDHGAIEVWELVTGYGQDNTLSNNKLGTTGSAVGIYVSRGATGDIVSCSNTVIQPSAALSNQACSQ